MQFTPVKNLVELNEKLKNNNGKPVMLDFYADWCVACKELEATTFRDATVQALLKDSILLQVDVTQNSADDQALLKHFDLFGPPAIIFFNGKGNEQASIKTIGYQNPQKFVKTLNARNL